MDQPSKLNAKLFLHLTPISAVVLIIVLSSAALAAANFTTSPTASIDHPLLPDASTPTPTPAATPTPFKDEAGVEMVQVPAGCFMMGSDTYENEGPVNQQCFDQPFWIDRTEVTRTMYQACVDAGQCSVPPASQSSVRGKQPINNVTWFQARDYCTWRGARLPTEREWEYAARGPDSLVYPWGNDFNADNVVFADSSGGFTAATGSRRYGASWVGALDMSGNVWEWVSSKYMPYPYTPDDGREDLSDETSYRVLRGGSYYNDAYNVRAAVRSGFFPDFVYDIVGFRCAKSN